MVDNPSLIKMGDPVNFNFGEVVGLKGVEGVNANSNYSVMSELVGGAWELEPDHFADVSLVYHDDIKNRAEQGENSILYFQVKHLI